MAQDVSERFPPGPSPFFPANALKVLGAFGPGNIEGDEDWYERVHAPDFWRFAPPYMARYARNWVRSVEAGADPAFVVLTEIQFQDEAAKAALRPVMNSAAAAHLFQHMAERAAFMGERFKPAGSALLPVTSRAVAGSSEGVGPRKLMLLRRGGQAFEACVLEAAAEVARTTPGAVVSVDFLSVSAPILSADAIIYVEGVAEVRPPDGGAAHFVSLLNVETRRSGVSAR